MDLKEIVELTKVKKHDEAKEKLYEYITDAPLSVNRLDAITLLAQVHGFLAEFEEAKKLLLEIIELGNPPEYLTEIIQAYSFFGTLCMQFGEIEAGIQKLKEGSKLISQMDLTLPESNLVAGQLHTSLGTLYSEKGNYSEALNCLKAALELLERSNNQVQYSRTLYNIGATYSQQSQYDKALKYLNMAIKVQEQTGNLIGVAYSNMAIGEIYQRKGELDVALNNFEQEFQIFMEHGSVAQKGWAYTDMGNIHLLMGKINKAIDYFLQALPIYEQVGQPRTLANHLRSVANAYRLKGEYIISLNFNQHARKLYQDLGNDVFEEKAIIALAKDYLSLGNLDQALDLSNQAYELSKQNNNLDDIIAAMNLLTKVYIEIGNQDEGDRIIEEFKQYLNDTVTLSNRHTILLSQSLYHKSKSRIPDLNKSLELANTLLVDELSDMVNYIDALLIKADLFSIEIQIEYNEVSFEDLKSVVNELIKIADRERLVPLQITTGIMKSNLLLIQGEVEHAEQKLRSTVKQAEGKQIDKLIRLAKTELQNFLIKKPNYLELLAKGTKDNLLAELQMRQLLAKLLVDAELLETEEVKSVYFLLLSPEGKALYSKEFGDISVDEQLVGGFLTALQSFAGEAFVSSGSLERINFQEYNLLIKNFKEYNLAFIYSGNDLSAMMTLNDISDFISSDEKLVEAVKISLKTSRMLDPTLFESIFD